MNRLFSYNFIQTHFLKVIKEVVGFMAIRDLPVGETIVLNLSLVGSLVNHLELEGNPCHSLCFNKGKSTFYIKSNISIFLFLP